MSKHTPGPWKASALGRTVTDGAEQVVCRPSAYANNAERQVANARLIAAAPELLDALQEIVEAQKGGYLGCSHIDAASAAIAKATGG